MKRMTTSELRCKDVINLCNGSRLGHVCELEFDPCNGQICALILCRESGMFGFAKDERCFLPWCKIECIGEDAVLVKIPPDEMDKLFVTRKKTKDRDVGLF